MTDQPRPTDRTKLVPNDCSDAIEGPVLSSAFNVKPLSIEQLVLDHHALIYRYAYRLTGRQQDAEDLTQQTFMVAQQKLAQVRDPSKVKSWLYAVLRSRYLKMSRKPFPIAVANLELEVDEIPAASDDESIDLDQLQAAINQIPDDFKLVLLAFYFEECSYQEIAARLKVPVGTVMSRLSRGKARLRAILMKAESTQIAPVLVTAKVPDTTASPGLLSSSLASRRESSPTAVVFSKPSIQSPGGEIFARISHG